MAVGDGDEGGVADGARSRPVSSIVVITAIESQALPLVQKFQLSEDSSRFAEGFPWVRYSGIYEDLRVYVIWLGKDFAFGVDSVGTVSAALAAYESIQTLKPDLIINAGTAGGLKSKGASIGDVFLATQVAFHDRRNPLPVRDLYCIGSRPALATPNLLKELNLKVGKLSTGNSLDMHSPDEKFIAANDAAVKDMEGAAVAYVADLLKLPVVFIKAVTYDVDGTHSNSANYLENLTGGSSELNDAVARAIEFVNGKRVSEL